MSAGRYRITILFVAVATAALAFAGIVFLQTVMGTLRGAGVTPDVTAAVRREVIIELLALGVILLGVVLVAGRAVSQALRTTRAALLARARGDTADLPDFTVRELDELASAAERLFARVSARETELERNHHDVSILLDAISEGIVQLDASGRVVRANPAARQLLNLDSVAGGPVAAQIRHVELRRIFQAAAAGSSAQAVEITHRDRRLLVSARPIRDVAGGGGAGAVVSFIDLTEVRRLEGVRRDFVANVSHELKTPLTSIRGYVETILADDQLPPDVRRQFLEVVQKNANRLHRIVDDLLDLSRLESGGWRPEPRTVNVVSMVEDAWSSCSDVAQHRNITFVPPARGPAVTADPGALRQVLSNLLENALRYTPDGGRIEVCVLPPAGTDELVTLEVRDNGAGIASDALPRIFERFYRADPARTRAQGGTGLGLSIVKHLVESMGGDVAAESELGKGTVVRFRLPHAA